MAALPLQGKSALVTGGARRIGREIALALAKAGAGVAFTYRNSKIDAADTLDELKSLGVNAVAIQCDVRSEASVRTTVRATVELFGRLDILVNSAAIFDSAPLDSLTLEQWDAVFETNTRGPFLAAREAIPHLRSSHGRIINIGSLGGIRTWANHGHYCASKAALHMLTQAMAKGFAPDVTVNCVAPGWIEDASGGIEIDEQSSDAARRFADKTPMRRNGTADDVAQAVVFFATGPGFITGQILAVDGGLSLT